MYQTPDYINMSLALSEVLNELGLNEEIVSQRRRSLLLFERTHNIQVGLLSISNFRQVVPKTYIFGSQIEGTTTIGLNSDYDVLSCCNNCNVIQDWKEWKPDVLNLMMVYDVTTSPGYCMLQRLRSDVPLPEIIDQYHIRDSQGRILLKNTSAHRRANVFSGVSDWFTNQHGPADCFEVTGGPTTADHVEAFPCRSVLEPVRQWLSDSEYPWPTEEMKTYIANCECFLVPVGSRGSDHVDLEWRISTSLAERCLMFNLNITQLQVYVLMKMFLKTCINYNVQEENNLSSYICKTVLLYCIKNSEYNAWQSHRLLECLLYCLSELNICVINENCHHFIIAANNLMSRRFTLTSKRQLNKNFQYLFQDFISHGILSIHIDNVSTKFTQKFSRRVHGLLTPADDYDCQKIPFLLYVTNAHSINVTYRFILFTALEHNTAATQAGFIRRYILSLEHIYSHGDPFDRCSSRLLTPFLCAYAGSLMASYSIEMSNTISQEARDFFALGLNSDVAFGRLKFASAVYSVCDFVSVERIVRDAASRYDRNTCEPVCVCHPGLIKVQFTRFKSFVTAQHEFDIPKLTASCVIFMPIEKYCVPGELQYEMYRSTTDELLHRGPYDYWMDWAVIDALPYLYFLQYKVYGQLRKRDFQQRALNNLMLTIQQQPNLHHRETALNLLGQCMVQENRWNDALQCYRWSLSIRPRNNAAKLLICLLMFRRLCQT